METLSGKGLCLLKALTLLTKLFWEVTSPIQEQYSQAIIVPHFVITGLHIQRLKSVAEER